MSFWRSMFGYFGTKETHSWDSLGPRKVSEAEISDFGGARGRVNRDFGTLSWVCLRGLDLEGRLARPRGSNLEDFGRVFQWFWAWFRVHFRFSFWIPRTHMSFIESFFQFFLRSDSWIFKGDFSIFLTFDCTYHALQQKQQICIIWSMSWSSLLAGGRRPLPCNVFAVPSCLHIIVLGKTDYCVN